MKVCFPAVRLNARSILSVVCSPLPASSFGGTISGVPGSPAHDNVVPQYSGILSNWNLIGKQRTSQHAVLRNWKRLIIGITPKSKRFTALIKHHDGSWFRFKQRFESVSFDVVCKSRQFFVEKEKRENNIPFVHISIVQRINYCFVFCKSTCPVSKRQGVLGDNKCVNIGERLSEIIGYFPYFQTEKN